jgi:hypothetical protein
VENSTELPEITGATADLAFLQSNRGFLARVYARVHTEMDVPAFAAFSAIMTTIEFGAASP